MEKTTLTVEEQTARYGRIGLTCCGETFYVNRTPWHKCPKCGKNFEFIPKVQKDVIR